MINSSEIDQTMRTSTPDFFNSAWDFEQSHCSLADSYPANNGYDNFAHYQSHLIGDGNSEVDYFSYLSEQQQYQISGGLFHISIDDVDRILTPGLSFLAMNVDSESNKKGLHGPTSHLSVIQPQRAHSNTAASLAPDLNGTEARLVNSWPIEANMDFRKHATASLDNDEERETPQKHGQFTPSDSAEDGQILGRKISNSSQTGAQDGDSHSARGKGHASITAKSETMTEIAGVNPKPVKKPRKSKKKPLTKEQEEAKRKRFLERNRVAADKCRQNRKKWIEDLQEKVHMYRVDNQTKKDALQEIEQEIRELKTILLMHSRKCKNGDTYAWMEKEGRLSQRQLESTDEDDALAARSLVYSTSLSVSSSSLEEVDTR